MRIFTENRTFVFMKNGMAFLAMLCLWNIGAQTLQVRDSIALKDATFIGYDNLGAVYAVAENVLIKTAGSQRREFRMPQLGKITRVDLLNPLKLLVFFQDFNSVVLLDNQLNVTDKIDFSQRTDDPVLVQAAGLASGNRIWLYDGLSQKIGLYDFMKKEWRKLTTPLQEMPLYYDSDYNYFRWVNDKGEALSCDVYGKIQSLGSVPENQQLLWASDKILLYRNGANIYRYNLVENKSERIEIDKKTFKNFSYKDQILSIFTDQGITNYKISIP